MYDDYEESFFYDKSKESSTDFSKPLGEFAGGIIGTVLAGIILILLRFDIISSAMLSLVFFMLTSGLGWSKYVYIIVASGIFVVSMVLQHKMKVIRLIYGIFGCIMVAILATIFIGYESEAEMYRIFAISLGVSALCGIISWKHFV